MLFLPSIFSGNGIDRMVSPIPFSVLVQGALLFVISSLLDSDLGLLGAFSPGELPSLIPLFFGFVAKGVISLLQGFSRSQASL